MNMPLIQFFEKLLLYFIMLSYILIPTEVSAQESTEAKLEDETNKIISTINYDNSSLPVHDVSKRIHFSISETFNVSEYETKEIHWFTSIPNVENIHISFDKKIMSISNSFEMHVGNSFNISEYYITENATWHSDSLSYGIFNITGELVGVGDIDIVLLDANKTVLYSQLETVLVLLDMRELNDLTSYILAFIFAVALFVMGCNLNLELVKNIAKKPIGPTIGFFCQYLIMPVTSYVIGLIVFPNKLHYRISLLTIGCAPGGGLSNIWTYYFGGNLDLSIVMTFVSNVAALGMTSLWILTLGRAISNVELVIPYINVIATIAVIVVPVVLGVIVQLLSPRAAKIISKTMPVVATAEYVVTLSIGIYVNLYGIYYLTWKVFLSVTALTMIGFFSGFGIAFLFKQTFKDMLAIAIETACQNNAMSFLILKFSLPEPYGDLAAVLPGANIMFLPISLGGLLILSRIIQWCSSKSSREKRKNLPLKNLKAVEKLRKTNNPQHSI